MEVVSGIASDRHPLIALGCLSQAAQQGKPPCSISKAIARKTGKKGDFRQQPFACAMVSCACLQVLCKQSASDPLQSSAGAAQRPGAATLQGGPSNGVLGASCKD